MSFSRRYAKDKSRQHASRLNFNKPTQEPSRIKWRGIFFTMLMTFFLIVLSIVWHYRDEVLFPIKNIDLQGTFDSTDNAELSNILAVHAAGSMLLLSVDQLKLQLEHLSWVDHVSIRRLWPYNLQVSVTKKQAVARFGDTKLFTADGKFFVPSSRNIAQGLPYISGPENLAPQLLQTYFVLSKILLPSQLKILRLEVNPRLSYSLELDNGITVDLGSTDINQRLSSFVKVYNKSLKAKVDQIQYVDMRYNSGMAVGLKVASAAKQAAIH
jgi:cell division protein FtsQ